ncbi:MAG TPA: LysM peptidoglycan-binding domain-containing protein [Phycisphaerales bacterium]|nr:LysM peptidoglycan-binding domain-containing protein [Phycisphaerales bacterium]
MTRNPSKLVFAMAVLLGVWVAVFWLWKPRATDAGSGRISYGQPPDIAAAQVATDRDLSPAPRADVAPLPVAPLPAPNAPQPVQPAPLPGKRLIAPEFTEYTVQAGDGSFAAISRRVYGTAAHAEAISRANPFVPPNKLVVGRTRLKIPKDPANIQGRVEEIPGAPAGEPDAAAASEHTVQPGETLGAISKRYYGTTTRWKAILEANSDLLDKPEKLRAGMTLRIPPKD